MKKRSRFYPVSGSTRPACRRSAWSARRPRMIAERRPGPGDRVVRVLATMSDLARRGRGPARCGAHPLGLAPTASTRPTGAGPRSTWARTSVAVCRSGTAWGRTSNSGQFAASVGTSPPAGGRT